MNQPPRDDTQAGAEASSRGTARQPTILIPFQLYVPGDEGGGPIRSMSNLVERLDDTFDFKILTSGDNLEQAGEDPEDYRGRWVEVGAGDVRYLTDDERTVTEIARLALELDYDAVYLNGFFPTRFTLPFLIFKWLGVLEDVPVVLVPRGQFYEGALSQKRWKKAPFIRLVRWLGLYDDIVWQATADEEREQIRTYFGDDAEIRQAPNLGTIPDVTPGEDWPWPSTESGELNAVFLSRISPKKNLPYALRLLGELDGEITFDIYGPIWSDEYWEECLELIDGLPSNVEVTYHGAIDHGEVFEVFGTHDLFWFPTQGENFGHVIFESLISGCPVLLSDETPWDDLADHDAGWTHPLADEEAFVDRLQWCVDADESAYRRLRESAHAYALRQAKEGEGVQRSRRLFEYALRVRDAEV